MDAELAGLWFEPWTDAHAAWLGADVAPAGWKRHIASTAPSARLGYLLWCRHFRIEPQPPADLAWPDGMTLAAHHLQACALRVGMMACASEPGFAQQWISDREPLLAAAPAAWWGETARWARLRPLRMQGALHAGELSRDRLVALGLAGMRHAVLALQPQLWSRVQFRCDRRLLDAAAVPAMTAASCLQVQRIWRLVSIEQVQQPP